MSPTLPGTYKWIVPINVMGFNDFRTEKPLILGLQNLKLTIDVPSGLKWFIVNADQCGYFRTNYTVADWGKLAKLLLDDPNALGDINTAGLLDDALTLAESEYLPYETALNMTLYMFKGTEFLPLYVVLELHMNKIASLLEGTKAYAYAREYFSKIVSRHLKPLSSVHFAGKTLAERWFQSFVINKACVLGIESCTRTAKAMFDSWLFYNERKPPADILDTVYNAGMWSSGIIEWKILRTMYLSVSDDTEKQRLRAALCQIREPWIIEITLILARKDDLIAFLTVCADNPVGLPVVWDYIQNSWKKLAQDFSSSFIDVIETVTNSFSTDLKLKEVQNFINKIPVAFIGADASKRILEGIKQRIYRKQKYAPSLSNWFKEALQYLKHLSLHNK